MPRSHLVAYALAAAVVLVVGVRQVVRADRPAASGAPISVARSGDDAPRDRGMIVVHVAGAVHRPGVYRLRPGARVADAVQLAGGARPRADLTLVNLAQRLEDGRQVVVPLRAAGAPAGGAAAVSPSAPLNLNTATLEQLDELDGIGPATAQAILTYREQHGGFSDVEELDQVPGIGEITMATLREAVTV